MKVHKGYKTRTYPTIKQRKQLACHFGASRWVYNHFLQLKNDQYIATGKSATLLMMSRELTKLRSEINWLGGVSRQCVGTTLQNLDVAFNNFFEKRAKYPKFKKKHNRQSFKISSPFCPIKLDGVHIPLIGTLKCKLQLPKEYKLYSVAVSKTPTNKYFISVNYECEIKEPKVAKYKPKIGLDFGLKTFITTSDGSKIDHPRPFRKLQEKLARAQRALNRRKLGSKRRGKAKLKVALVNEKIANVRSDFLHKLSRGMIGENQAIYLEDLNLKGMQVRFGKAINDSGWREFTKQLEYKGIWYGCDVFKVDRFFPSSKRCSKCGLIKDNLCLRDRSWTCSCGAAHDRDVNAAKNVLQYGRADRNLRSQRATLVSCSTKREAKV